MPDDLRARVLAAAITVIDEGGLDALSMREVARRAGVSHQAPYHHFRDREGILAALVEEGFTRLADTVEAAVRGSGSGAAGPPADERPLRRPRRRGGPSVAPLPARPVDAPFGSTDALAAAGVAYVRFALGHPAHFRVMFRPDLVPLERWPAARAQAARAHAALADAVSACEAAGLVRPGEHDDVVAGAWALVHGLAVLLLDGPLAARSGAAVPGGDSGGDTPGAPALSTHADALAARVAPLIARLLSERAAAR